MDHGMLGHAKTLYNELVSVPLLIKFPRGSAAVVEDPVGLIDLYPTVLDIQGIEARHSLAGRSLVAGHEPHLVRPVFSETSRRRELRGVVANGYKLVLDLETGEKQLFHLESDTSESLDLSASEPERVESMTRYLDQWMRETGTVVVRRPDVELDSEERERLRRLGYL